MNDIRENNDYEGTDQKPNWTNLACPSCAIYYGVQLLISGIKKKRKNRTNTVIPNNNTN